jgi:putative transcriptional regulator
MSCSFKNRLAECRAAKGIKKSQLAYYIGMSRGYVTRLERGDISPSAEAMMRIARYFGKPVEEIFQLVEEDKRMPKGEFKSSSFRKEKFPFVSAAYGTH